MNSPERDWLLASLHLPLHAETLELLKQPIDRDILLRNIEAFQVTGVVYQRLRKLIDPSPFIAELIDQLQAQYYQGAGNMARLYVNLGALLKQFHQREITAVVLKGPALALTVYRDIGSRVMHDIDLLIGEQEIDRAWQIMVDIGYYARDSYQPTEWYRNHHHHLVPLASSDNTHVVELHRHILPKHLTNQFHVEDLWQRSQSFTLPSGDTRRLSTEDLLLHLCVHLTEDTATHNRLRAIVDVQSVIVSKDHAIEWQDFVVRTQTYQLGRHVFFALWLVHETLGTVVPHHVIRDLQADMAMRAWEVRMLQSILRDGIVDDESQTSVPTSIRNDAKLVLLQEGTTLWKVSKLVGLFRKAWWRSAKSTRPNLGVLFPFYAVFVYPFQRSRNRQQK